MLIKDVKAYANTIKHYAKEDIDKLVKVYINGETVFEDDGKTEVKAIDFDVEDVEVEQEVEKRIEQEVNIAVKKIKKNKNIVIHDEEHLPRIECVNERKSTAFKSQETAYKFGKWALATLYQNKNADQWCQDKGLITKGTTNMTGGSGNYGSALVPDIVLPSIVELVDEYSVTTSNASHVAMGSDTLKIPRVTTFCDANWVSEAGSITQVDTVIQASTLTARKLAAYHVLSREINQDAVISVADLVARGMASKMGYKIDYATFLGDGGASYGYITGLHTQLTDTVTAGTTYLIDKFLATVAAIPQYARAGSKWFCNKDFYYQKMAALAFAAGGSTIKDVEGGFTQSFLGYPVIETNVLADVSNTSTGECACIFGNFSQNVYVGDIGGITVDFNTQSDTYWVSDLIGIRSVMRVAIANDINTASMIEMVE
jgi:HK97 family phage major capsid protein